ncbi:hypothetical protein PR048_013753 [Dryococelus australis]|uniref:Uncharacterized protein n=1 Tax=Dryococelus australis TaxID=614101 RepID=A0ABQ9HT15_9NEOP|nr:hypothetical protein PR048_013753 [Dryococelus australis]
MQMVWRPALGQSIPDMSRLSSSIAKQTSFGKLRGGAKRPDASCPKVCSNVRNRFTQPIVLTKTIGFYNNFTSIDVIVNTHHCRALSRWRNRTTLYAQTSSNLLHVRKTVRITREIIVTIEIRDIAYMTNALMSCDLQDKVILRVP